MNNSSHFNTTVSPRSSQGFSLSDPTFTYTIAACYISIGAVAAVGNFLVCFAILTNRHLRSNPTNFFLLSLAVSDLLTVSLAMPFDIESLFLQGFWRHGKIICVTFVTVFINNGPNPILTLLVLSVDRYKNLKDPLRRFRGKQFMTQKKALIVISIIWIYSIIWALLPIMGWRVKGLEPLYKGFCMVPYTRLYNFLSVMIILALMVITCVFYIKTYLIARKHHRRVPRFNTKEPPRLPSKDARKFFTRNLKAVKTTSMFVAAFFFCYQPYAFFHMAGNLYGNKHWNPYPWKVRVALLMLYYFNSALNPFLFALRNNSFKATYVKLFNSLKPAADSRSNCSIVSRKISSEIPEMHMNAIRLKAIRYKRETPDSPTETHTN